MGQRQKPKAQRQQNQEFVMDYRASNVGVAAKEQLIQIHGCSHTYLSQEHRKSMQSTVFQG